MGMLIYIDIEEDKDEIDIKRKIIIWRWIMMVILIWKIIIECSNTV